MKIEYNDNGEISSLFYSHFEVEMAGLLFKLYGGTTEPLHEQKKTWEYIQDMKKLAQAELEEKP